MISRGLIISLGFTTLCTVVTYFYFKNRIDKMEGNLVSMLDLIKTNINHKNLQAQQTQSFSQNMTSNMNSDDDIGNNSLIEVSDNETLEDSEDSDTDSEESDTDSEEEVANLDDNNGDLKKINLADLENVEVLNLDNKKVNIEKENDNLDVEEIETNDLESFRNKNTNTDNDIDNDSLDELSDLEDNNIALDNTKDMDKESSDEDETNSNAETQKTSNEDDLKKLTVSVLKSIAEKKGLTSYKSLKKQKLIDLILANE